MSDRARAIGHELADTDEQTKATNAALAQESFGFTFDGEAGESFQTMADKMIGWIVRITDEDGKQFDAMLHGAARESEWVNDVLVRRIRESDHQPEGEQFVVTVRNIHVY